MYCCSNIEQNRIRYFRFYLHFRPFIVSFYNYYPFFTYNVFFENITGHKTGNFKYIQYIQYFYYPLITQIKLFFVDNIYNILP